MRLELPFTKDPNLCNQVAIITGSSGGIGQEIARVLLRSQIKGLALVDKEDKVEDLNGLETSTVIRYWKCDVSQVKEIERVTKEIFIAFKRIDILITCAGMASSSKLEEISEDEWDLILNVNLKGTFFFIQKVFPYMVKQNYGKIVCLGSIAGRRPGPLAGFHYVASKGGVHALVKRLAYEGAKYSIYVNAIAPGPIKTRMWDEQVVHVNIHEEDLSLLNRIGYPQDVAGVVLFLVSSASNWITGITLDVNAGTYMG